MLLFVSQVAKIVDFALRASDRFTRGDNQCTVFEWAYSELLGLFHSWLSEQLFLRIMCVK